MKQSKRVRYKKVAENVLSSQEFISTVEMLTATIDLNTRRYWINNHLGVKKSSGAGESRAELMLLVKRDLKALGVRFSDEVRRRPARKKGGTYESSGHDMVDLLLVGDLRSGTEDGASGGTARERDEF